MSSKEELVKTGILYIDDQVDVLADSLKLFEEDYGYQLITESSVENSLITLESYFSVIDAIILDLRFQNTAMQGKAGLKIIKDKYPWIPVFILTGASNLEDEEEARECLKLGADFFYHKEQFDIKTFMTQVAQASKIQKDKQQLRQVKDYTSRLVQAPYFYINQDQEKENIGFFAFKLKKIINDIPVEIQQNWIKDVAQILSNFSFVKCTQIYKSTNDGIAIYFLFTIEDIYVIPLNEIFDDLYFNLSYHFSNKSNHIVDFDNVIKKKELIDLIKETQLSEKGYELNRNIYKFDEENTSIGFNKNRVKVNKDTYNIPIHFIKNDENFDTLFHHLETTSGIIIFHTIAPYKLSVKEIGILKKIQKKLIDVDQRPYLDSINDFLINQNKLFTIKTLCYLPNKTGYSSLLNLVNRIFYNGNATTSFPNKKRKKQYLSNISDLISVDSLTNIIKLPKMEKEGDVLFEQESIHSIYFPKTAYEQNNICLGVKNNKIIGIDPNQFKKHTYIIGKTGTGKTSILYSMLMDRIRKDEGLALIDPHGDLFDKVIDSIPNNRKGDLITFDPTNPENNFSFNILEFDPKFPEQQSFIVDELLKTFNELYDMKVAGGPMFEMYFRNTMFLVLETVPNVTLDHIIEVFVNKIFRDDCLQKTNNQKVKNFFMAALKTTGEQAFENFAPYIASKLTKYTDNHFLSKIICDANKSFDFRKMMDEKKILLVKFNKGRIGEEGVNFMGRILFNRIIMSSYTRNDTPENQRTDFSLFVDEFQNFTSRDIITALSESRKYHLHLILANQTFAQLDEKLMKNILSNVGSIITASISPFDADILVPFFAPNFDKQNLVQLDNYKFIISTLYNNKKVNSFMFNSIPY